jgi:uncharacterized protein with gpF-like domain
MTFAALDATSDIASVSANPVQPQQAIDWFDEKRNVLTKEQWLGLGESARKRAFTVAWITNVAVLSDIKTSLDKALASGQSFTEWKKGIDEKIGGKWRPSEAHLETIFRNNLQSAYNAGRFRAARDPLTMKLRPYWKLTVVMDDRTSPFCSPLVAPPVVLPADDPWWDSNYPPRHHRCRASVVTLSKRAAERQGITKKAPTTQPQDGWGSTDFGDWQPDATKYDPAIFKKAADSANAP